MKRSRVIKDLQIEVKSIHKRLRKIEGALELLPTVTSFDGWKNLTLRDKKILTCLSQYGPEGTSTLQLAKDLDLNKPETSGRTIITRRLRRIQTVSLRVKGAPLVNHTGKKWALNFEDFVFELE